MSDLREVIAALGVDDAEIEAAEADGTLLALIAERFLLPGEKKYDIAQVASLTGLDPSVLKQLWLALGFPVPADDDRSFRDGDIDAIRTLLSDGTVISNDYMLHEARAISSSLARIAEVFIDEMWDQHFAEEKTQAAALGEMAGSHDAFITDGPRG